MAASHVRSELLTFGEQEGGNQSELSTSRPARLENDWTAALVWYGVQNEDVDLLVSGKEVPDAMRW